MQQDLGELFGRRVYLMESASLTDIVGPANVLGKYIAVIVMDGAKVADKAIVKWAHDAIAQGAVSLVMWGPDCERVRRYVDFEAMEASIGGDASNVIMTADCPGEKLESALEYALGGATIAKLHKSDTRSVVCFVVNNREWAGTVRKVVRKVRREAD